MNVGIIVEYNPFHNGHLNHIKKAKALNNTKNIIVILSGNFVQRGEPAICDKYSRTKMALINGADLVIELPIFYATSSAEYFAKGAVSILEKINIIDSIFFGSECGDITQLNKIANILLKEDYPYKLELKKLMDEGNSFPFSRAQAVMSVIDTKNNILNSPNNILGVEYLKALKIINSKIKTFTLKRESSEYNSTKLESKNASATAIRKGISKNNLSKVKKAMPPEAFKILEKKINNNLINKLDNFSNYLHYIVKTKNIFELNQVLDISEGLENRIVKAFEENYLLTDILDNIKTKRFTYTRIQRALLHILLDMKKEEFYLYENSETIYARVLGFKKEKSYLVSELNKKSSIPVIMNLKSAKNILNPLEFSMLQKEISTTDIYYLGLLNKTKNAFHKNIEYEIPLVII